ncbi:hypothetical protein CAAN1_01S13102 [[Candida] anglica]|uniref:DUF1892-domain-containing protein n=1 Tax=[Candida] anglica TaxID=148631 RepID=A0ABP0EKK2_9ASCO
MSDSEVPPHIEEDGVLDNPLRAIIVINSPDVPEGEMQERLLDTIQSFDDMNKFFDKFDEIVAIPNEEHIKYEVGSDGMVVVIVDSKELQEKALTFIDEYVGKETSPEKQEEEEEDQQVSKKKRV